MGTADRMGTLHRMGTALLADGRSRAATRQTLRRRRHVLLVLLALVIVTLVVAVAARQPHVWAAQVLADLLLGGYVAGLIHLRDVAAGLEMSHRELRH